MNKSIGDHIRLSQAHISHMGIDVWKVLIVDRDRAVHRAARSTLTDYLVNQRPVNLLSAYSAEDAVNILQSHPECGLALIDARLSPEGDSDEGIILIDRIRRILQNKHIRLVVHTSCPDPLTEHETVADHEINGYFQKADLTGQSLKTLCHTQLRNYQQLVSTDKHLADIHQLLKSISVAMQSDSLQLFGISSLDQVNFLLSNPVQEVYICRFRSRNEPLPDSLVVASYENVNSAKPRFDQLPGKLQADIRHSSLHGSLYLPDRVVLRHQKNNNPDLHIIAFIMADGFNQKDIEVLNLYGHYIGLVHSMLAKSEDANTYQKQLMIMVEDAVEARSRETGTHARRVAIMSEMLALSAGLDPDQVELIRLASPLHDVGKVAIPDSILHKPGKLSLAEWEVMKTHSETGARLLAQSDQPEFRMGASIAACHHERWDGKGYPHGLSGSNIPIEARIVSIIDVFDALSANRSYKVSWTDDDIKDFIASQRGKMFDPALTDLFIYHFHRFAAVKYIYPG